MDNDTEIRHAAIAVMEEYDRWKEEAGVEEDAGAFVRLRAALSEPRRVILKVVEGINANPR